LTILFFSVPYCLAISQAFLSQPGDSAISIINIPGYSGSVWWGKSRQMNNQFDLKEFDPLSGIYPGFVNMYPTNTIWVYLMSSEYNCAKTRCSFLILFLPFLVSRDCDIPETMFDRRLFNPNPYALFGIVGRSQ
jgi:hypothetical protein